VLASHKAVDVLRSEGRAKRGGGSQFSADDVQAVLSEEPTPEFAALMNDYCDWLLSQLEPGPRSVALLKLEGCTNEEVAIRLNCGIRTVERRLELIRRVWSDAAEQDEVRRSAAP
jgi:DNA-directed RNA polymerase specialized sigma24 family protein